MPGKGSCSMSARDATMDLDFTKAMTAENAAPQAPLRLDTEIGEYRPGKGGNFIAYARRDAKRSPASPGPPAPEGPVSAGRSQSPPLPRLILLDIELPRISGFKILALLRQHPQTRV